MKRVLRALCIGALLVAAVSLAPGVPAADPPPEGGEPEKAPRTPDSEIDCLEAQPEAVTLPGIEPPPKIDLDVHVLLDGVDESLAGTLFAKAAESYSPLGITLRVSAYQTVSFEGTATTALFKQAKAAVGRARPRGADVVGLLTSKDVTGSLGVSVAGQADCIGGVRYPGRAFFVAEAKPEKGIRNYIGTPLAFFLYAQARVISHEIGHLLGAHHHYANCVEGIPSEASEGEVSPCTLMYNEAAFLSMNFSTINGVVVRGHAEQFARP